MAPSGVKLRIGGYTGAHVTPLSNYSPGRAVLTADAFRRRRLGKHLHRKAILHLGAMVYFALLILVIFRGPLGSGAAGLVFAFAGWRYLINRRQLDFLREAAITLGESVVNEHRLERSVYHIVMSYTFEGRTYSSQREIDQADHVAVLSREINLYALFDRRNPGKILSYRAGSVMPRWLTSRSEEGGAGEHVAQRPRLGQLDAQAREEVGIDG